MKHTNWYKDAIIYQIYPKSFCDSNNDGLGDVPGIISKLDYLKELGINCVWLSPVYDSPQCDNGYDIANYREIYKPFGTLEDFKTMLSEMHKRGIRLIMDLVVNHTSSEHAWFKSVCEDLNSPYKDYYIIRKGKKNGKKPPNNWTGFFGGSTWSKLPGSEDEYYLHLFDKGQPDLNWENPKVRNEVVDILKYWLDMGVDGFRCDVITLISKKQDFKNRFPKLALTGKDAFVNGPRLHEYLHMLYKEVYSNYDCMTVGETVLSKIDEVKALVAPEREELDMVFNFDHTDTDNFFGVKYLYRKFNLLRFKKAISRYQYGLANNQGWNSLFLENHDQRRCVGRFGTDDSEEYREISSKLLANTYFFLQGTPFIYQGQELAMVNYKSKDINDYVDVELKNMYNMAHSNFIFKLLLEKHLFDVSRDNPRAPFQWDDSEYAGFSSVEPWMKVNPSKDLVNAKACLENKESTFYYYQNLINIRKNNRVVKDGMFKLIDKHNKNVFAYSRENDESILYVVSNFTKKPRKNPLFSLVESYEPIVCNYKEIEAKTLKPYESRVYLIKK